MTHATTKEFTAAMQMSQTAVREAFRIAQEVEKVQSMSNQDDKAEEGLLRQAGQGWLEGVRQGGLRQEGGRHRGYRQVQVEAQKA
ncbi:hypothetical protein OS035_32385 [Rhizobium sp. 268]|uniref:hypothetical protein n=1 Tax=Rhizobium sp. 268 TaxID=2996375 RepID=UPI002F94F6B2